MLVHSFNPFGNLALSSLIAAIPIILFLLCLTVFKMKGIYAAITTLVVTLLIALPFFKLPGGIATGGVIEGFYQGIIQLVISLLWPFYYIKRLKNLVNLVQFKIAL